MKYVVLIAVLAIAYMLWRSSRLESKGAKPPPAAGPAPRTEDMVRCPVCAVHLPRTDAVSGADGLLYCSQEHRLKSGA